MATPSKTGKPRTGDFVFVFIVLVGLASSFANIYKFAEQAKPGNAVWAGVALVALSILLTTQLAKMRRQEKK